MALVASDLHGKINPMVTQPETGGYFRTLADRAWFAWQCLPRDPAGRPPTYRELERKGGLSNNVLRKIMNEQLRRPGYETILRIARALDCSADWLMTGRGDGPVASYPVPPRPPPPKRSKKSSGAALGRGEIRTFKERANKLAGGTAPGGGSDTSK